VLANGRLELRWYLREQTLSEVVHRYGNVGSRDTMHSARNVRQS
jgi:hypothetical protein